MGCGNSKKTDAEVEEERKEGVWRARVEQMYRTYNPEKLHEVDTILVHCKGKEHSLMRSLIKKYGPEPDSRLKRKPGDGPRMDPDDIPREIRYLAHKDKVEHDAVVAAEEAKKKKKKKKKKKGEEKKEQLFTKSSLISGIEAEKEADKMALSRSGKSGGSLSNSGTHLAAPDNSRRSNEGAKTSPSGGTPPHVPEVEMSDSDSDLGIEL